MIRKALDFIIKNNRCKVDVTLIKNNELNIYMLQNLYVELKENYQHLKFDIKYA